MTMDQFIKTLEKNDTEKTSLKSFLAILQRQIEVQKENNVVFGDNFRMM